MEHKFPVKEDIPQKSIHNVAIKCALTSRRITSSYDFEIVSINQRELGRETFLKKSNGLKEALTNRFVKNLTRIGFYKKITQDLLFIKNLCETLLSMKISDLVFNKNIQSDENFRENFKPKVLKSF